MYILIKAFTLEKKFSAKNCLMKIKKKIKNFVVNPEYENLDFYTAYLYSIYSIFTLLPPMLEYFSNMFSKKHLFTFI